MNNGSSVREQPKMKKSSTASRIAVGRLNMSLDSMQAIPLASKAQQKARIREEVCYAVRKRPNRRQQVISKEDLSFDFIQKSYRSPKLKPVK